jgi:two-component system phosphate regulon sensor histidine kinase PhoR
MKKRFFPWRLFWSFFFSLALLLNGLCLLTMAVASFVFNFEFFSLKNLIFGSSFFVISIFGSFIFAYRFALPLRRVILKALRMANKQLFFQISGAETDEELLFQSEPGEYFELEQALDQIRRKMKKRREQLAHEREEAMALMSSIEDGVVNISPQGKIIYFNSGFAAHYLNKEQMQRATEQPLQLTKVLRDAVVLELFDHALKEGKGGNLQRQMSTLAGGGIRYLSITISPLRDPKTKEIYGAMGIFHDITELKRAESIRMEFVENASHELRTPLTSVKGYLETFKEDFYAGRTEQASFFLNTISKNVDRLTELVSDLLTISSLERGTAPEIETVYVDQIMTEVIERLSPLAAEKGTMISYRIEDDVSSLQVDPSKIEQVLENLVGNAIKYGKRDGGRVQVVWRANKDSKQICLHVIDDGFGIPQEHLSRLFERFYRVDKARSREVGGTGLGLAIVKHIVQSHGGSVSVQSEEGKGSEFICCFPDRT